MGLSINGEGILLCPWYKPLNNRKKNARKINSGKYFLIILLHQFSSSKWFGQINSKQTTYNHYKGPDPD